MLIIPWGATPSLTLGRLNLARYEYYYYYYYYYYYHYYYYYRSTTSIAQDPRCLS